MRSRKVKSVELWRSLACWSDEPAYQLSMTINPEATGISPSLLENTAPLKPRPTDDAADIEASCLVMADKEACWMCSSKRERKNHSPGTVEEIIMASNVLFVALVLLAVGSAFARHPAPSPAPRGSPSSKGGASPPSKSPSASPPSSKNSSPPHSSDGSSSSSGGGSPPSPPSPSKSSDSPKSSSSGSPSSGSKAPPSPSPSSSSDKSSSSPTPTTSSDEGHSSTPPPKASKSSPTATEVPSSDTPTDSSEASAPAPSAATTLKASSVVGGVAAVAGFFLF
ncbi:hypothetical protein V6N13_083845 [Hibiscus sabdariffa]